MTASFLLILLAPFVGAITIGLGWRTLTRRFVETLACGSIFLSFLCACASGFLSDGTLRLDIGEWISIGGFDAGFSFRLDDLSLPMTVMVTGVSFLIHVYATGYMRKEEDYARFFFLMNLFVLAMLILVTAGNLPLLYLGWEGVGFCSFALIGYWHHEPRNLAAAKKAFVTTRVGDAALGAAMVWLFTLTGTFDIDGINTAATSIGPSAIIGIGLLLLLAAAGKSAQLPLSVWLPDAMAGPTPVSALIHAATMVTAGVFLLVRLFPVISVSETVLAAVAVTGGVTAFYAATAAVAQREIKRVLAYSTMSQIGLMFLGVGVGAPGAAFFHLLTHAYFKALLFLGAGYVIQALHEENEIAGMGGLRRRMPMIFWVFLAGALSLAGVPGTAGFMSKDAILTAVLGRGDLFHTGLWLLAEATSLLTVFYITRLMLLVFAGEGADRELGKNPAAMGMATMGPLAALSIVGGWIPTVFIGAAPAAIHGAAHSIVLSVGAAVIVAGFLMARFFHSRKAAWLIDKPPRILFEAWGLDRLYLLIFSGSYAWIAGALTRGLDRRVIDSLFDGFASLIRGGGKILRMPVTGRASFYLLSILAGAGMILLFMGTRG